MNICKHVGVSILVLIITASTARSSSLIMTWADFSQKIPVAGATTTIQLGGGSTIDVTITIGGGTKVVSSKSFGSTGAAETGLPYSALNTFGIFNGGGGTTKVKTTVTFSNVHVSPQHVGGYLFVGALADRSSSITVSSSVTGAAQTWTQVGSTFAIGTDTATITWNPGSGELKSEGSKPDSRGIVLAVGDLARYAKIELTFEQNLEDGVFFSIGEAVETRCSFGACCTGVVCVQISSTACRDLGGVYLGEQSSCEVGACCVGNKCALIPASECVKLGGNYLGDKSKCDSCR